MPGIAISMSLCLSVCLFVCPVAYLKNHMPKFHRNYPYMLPVAMARSFFQNSAIRYVLSVLWMTPCFYILGPVEQSQRRRYVSSRSPDGGNGGEVASSLL